MKDDFCNRCNMALTTDNWHPSAAKRRWLICKGCANVRMVEYNRVNPDKVFKKNMERRYGITYEEYLVLLNKQDYVCAICKQPERNAKRQNLSIDHCHETGRIRGLLCNNCNTALGKFSNLKLLEAAKEYLC